MATKNIKALGNAQALGWTDALLSRLAANSVGLGARLSITAPADASALSSTGYSLTGSNASSMIDLAGTWNTTGSPIAMRIAISNTASGSTAKFLSFLAGASGTTEVLSVDKAGILSIVGGGSSGSATIEMAGRGAILQMYGSAYGTQPLICAATGGFSIATDTGSFRLGASSDLRLDRDAANTLALRNSTNAQAFNIYNTYSSGSVYERGFMRWVSNVLEIGTEHVGASARAISIRSATGQVKVFTQTYSVNSFISLGATDSGSIFYQSNALGQHYSLVGDTTSSGGPAELRCGSGFTLNWRSTTRSDSGSNDSGLARTIAGVVGVTNGSTGGGALGLVEMTSPAAPATNGVYIFAEDNGSGKTRLMARFATGATQQLAIEP